MPARTAVLWILFSPGLLPATTLGVATNWNVFAFDGITYSNTSTSTGLAAGNGITLTNMFISEDIAPNNTSVQVFSAGSVNLSNGSVNGSIQYATTGTSSATIPAGATFSQAPSPFDFAMLKAQFENYSSNLAGLTTTGTSSVAFSTLTLEGTNPGSNVFSVNSSGYGAGITNLILKIPVGATAVINVQGSNVTYNYAGFDTSFGSTPASKILWNLPDATAASTSGVALLGTVMAPKSLVDLQNGSLTGQVVANSVIGGSFKLNYAQFNGAIPSPPGAVPEPSTFLLGGTALVAISLLRRCTKR